jgi:hypothetical protein
MNFLDFVVNNLEGALFCEEQKRSGVLKCFIKILEQRNLKKEEIDVILERTVEIVSLLHRERESRMKYFGVYLEVVECLLRKLDRIERVLVDTLACYKNVLVFVVKNCKKFPMDVHVSVVKGLGTLSSVKIPEDLEDSSYAKRCPRCGRNYMGLLAMMLVKDAVSNPCFVGEVLHSITEILKNECHEVEMEKLGLCPFKLKELCRTFIRGGAYFLKSHLMRNLVNVFNQNPNLDRDEYIPLFIIKLLRKYIDEGSDNEVILSDPQPEIVIWFGDMLFPEFNFDKEMCMILGLLNQCLNGVTGESSLCGLLYLDRLIGIISYSKLSYKFHQNSSEFICTLKNACRHFIQYPRYYKGFIKDFFEAFQDFFGEIGEWSELGDRSRISIIIALIRMVDVMFTDSYDPRRRIRDGMGLEEDFWLKTLEAIVGIRDFILSLYNENLVSREGALSQYIRNHFSKFALPSEFVDSSFWSLRGTDDGVGHINRTIDLLRQLQLFVFDRIISQNIFFGPYSGSPSYCVILSIIDEVKMALKLGGERNATCIEDVSEMGSRLGRILNTTVGESLGDLFFNIGIGDEMCEILTDGGNMTGITFFELKDPTFYTKKGVEIQTPYLSKILRFYYSLFGEIKERGTGNEDIARNLMVFLKYVSKGKMDINDTRIFVELVDMGYCIINGVKSVKYSRFINMIDHSSPFETGLAIIDSILDIKDECLKGAGKSSKYSGKCNENVIRDSIQKVSTIGFYHVRYKINDFISQLRCMEDVEVDTSSLIELISNNFLIYSFLNPCECGGDGRGECTLHYDKGRIVEFIDCLDKYLNDSTLEITLKSYSSLLKLSEMEKSPVSRVEIFKRFPLKKLLLLISSSKEFLSMFNLLKVVIEQFLESKECVRRLINNELLINKNGLDVDNVGITVYMWKSLAFRNMEIFVECITNEKKVIIARRDQSRDKSCELVVKKVIGCIGGGVGCGVLSLQLLCEIIFNHPCLSVLCENEGFIENTVWRFIEADCGEKSIWGRCFIDVIFTRTSNFKLKRMIFDSIISKMKTGNGSFLKNGFSLLLDIFNFKVHVEKYNFSENFVRDRKGINGHNCNGYCEIENIFKQNADALSDRRLFDLVPSEYGDYVPVGSDGATKFALLLKTLLLLHLKKVVHSNGDGTNAVNEEMVLSYLRDLKKEGEILSSEVYGPKLYKNHEGDGGMPDGSSNEKAWEEFWA